MSNLLGIYPGKFQPPTVGNFRAYEMLKKLTGTNTFISTNDVVNLPGSPLTFQDKQQIWTRHGVPIDKVVLTKDPMKAVEVTQKFGPDRTVAIFAMSKTDAALYLNKGGYFIPFKGIQFATEPMVKHGYVMVIPDEVLYINKQITPDTLRKLFGSKSMDEEKKKSFFKQLFGWYDISLFDLIKKKFAEASTVKERVCEGIPINFNYNATRKSNVVAPDISIKSMIDWMKRTYNVDYIGFEKGGGTESKKREYVFKREDGRELKYTTRELKNLGAPIGLMNMYSKRLDRTDRFVTGRGKPMRENMNESALPIIRRTLKPFIREIVKELLSSQPQSNQTTVTTDIDQQASAMSPTDVAKQKRLKRDMGVKKLKDIQMQLDLRKKKKDNDKKQGDLDVKNLNNQITALKKEI